MIDLEELKLAVSYGEDFQAGVVDSLIAEIERLRNLLNESHSEQERMELSLQHAAEKLENVLNARIAFDITGVRVVPKELDI